MRKLLVGLVSVLLGLLWVTGVALPAQARESNCLSKEVCLYNDANYYGCFYRWQGNDNDYRNNTPSRTPSSPNCPGSMNDMASSIDNDGRNCGSYHYVDATRQGAGFYIKRGGYVSTLNTSSTFSNELTSHRWC